MKETGEGYLLRFNEPEVLAAGVPGAGAVGGGGDVALFYQALLHNPGGVWSAEVLHDATSNVRNTLVDPLFTGPGEPDPRAGGRGRGRHGVMRGFGRSVGPRAFGAMGVGGQIAWADPTPVCRSATSRTASMPTSWDRSGDPPRSPASTRTTH